MEAKQKIAVMQRGVGGTVKGQSVTYTLSDGKKIQKVTDVVTWRGSVIRAALVERAVLERIGTRKGAYYRLAKKWDINGTFGTQTGTSPAKSSDEKRSDKMRQLWDKRDSASSRKKGATKPTTEEAKRKKRNGNRPKGT